MILLIQFKIRDYRSFLSLKDIKSIISSFYMILLKKEDTLLFCFSLKIQNNSLYFYERKFHYF